jgi:hypothetical protein
MPRIVWRDSAQAGGTSSLIDIHYGSPHDFLKDVAPGTSPEQIFLQTERALPAGSRHVVVLHIGFINRELRLNARVENVAGPAGANGSGRPRGMRLSLLGPDGCASPELHALIQQIHQGLACEAATGTMTTTGGREPRERQILTMPLTLKLMLARKAPLEDRLILANDVDPRTIEYLLKNPDIRLAEIRTISAQPTITTLHIQTILANGAWKADDQVRLNLARNPRLPDMMVEPLLQTLSVAHLQIVANSPAITARTKRVAHRLLCLRGH